jgi:hypothetical protein
MSIDYRDQLCNRPVDANGHELPPWLNPFLSDFDPALAEQADVAWLNENPTLPPITGGSPEPFEPSDADWDDYARWSGALTDDDLTAAGLPVG